VLRRRRESVLAGALPQTACACWCAAAAFAGGGLRKGLDRQRVWGRFRVSGSGLSLPSTQGSSFLRSWPTVLRSRVLSVDLQPQERFYGCRSTDGRRRAGRILPLRGPFHANAESCVPPTQRALTTLHSCVRSRTLLRSRRDPVGNAESLPSRTRTQKLASTAPPTHSPRPQTSAVASRPVEALSETNLSERRGSAALRPDPLRQRTSKVTTTAVSAPPTPDPPEKPSSRTSPAHLTRTSAPAATRSVR
jgi:hypothetical protein